MANVIAATGRSVLVLALSHRRWIADLFPEIWSDHFGKQLQHFKKFTAYSTTERQPIHVYP